MKTKARKSVLLILLIVVAALLSVSTLSYWAEAVAGATKTGDSTNAISIGAGGTAETVFVIDGGKDSDKKLVPVGRTAVSADPNNAVEQKLITYKVKWNSKNTQAGAGNNGTLKVTLGTPVIEGTNLGASLIKVEVVKNDLGIVVDGEEVTVTLKATFAKEPDNKTDYTAIQGKAFTVPVDFAVTPVA